MFSALAGEKWVFRTFVFNKFTAYDTSSDEAHNVAIRLVLFVGLPRRSTCGFPPPASVISTYLGSFNLQL
jgi:hypothetical protein